MYASVVSDDPKIKELLSELSESYDNVKNIKPDAGLFKENKNGNNI